MNDLSALIGRLLPFAVIASLVLIFYGLDIFSMRSGSDVAPAKPAARQASTAPAAVVGSNRLPPPPTGSEGPTNSGVVPNVPRESSGTPNNFAVESELPPRNPMPVPLPPPGASMGRQDELSSAAPRYIPPVGHEGQALATHNDGSGPVQLPSDEIPQDEGERIDAETLQAVDESEQVASQPGAAEQEQ